jgi:NitT/TauT family transport system ATP-binding protein
LFREASLEHVTILKQIDSILRRKSDHSIADEFFNDILDDHFSEDEVQRQLDTAMNWGRYAEIFDYDRENGRLTQTEAATVEIAGPSGDNQHSTPTPKA